MLNKVLSNINRLRARYLYEYSPYSSALAELPAELFPYWQQTASREFKGIPGDAFFFARAAEGLMMFFDCVRSSGRPCGLPSKAVDSVWHAWIALDQAHLQRFTVRQFGRAIAHAEGGAMSVPMEDALANCLVAARGIDGLPAAGPQVPRLFSIDRQLGMPYGYAYLLARGQVGHRRMTRQGRAEGEIHFLDRLMPASLLAAGLLSQSTYHAYVQELNSESDASCGGGCGN